MKQYILAVALFTILAILPVSIFAQLNCTIETRKTLQEKAAELAKEIASEYEKVHDRIEAKIKEAERIAASERIAMTAGGIWADAVKKRIEKPYSEARILIDEFLKKYEGKLPAWLKEHLLEDRGKLHI